MSNMGLKGRILRATASAVFGLCASWYGTDLQADEPISQAAGAPLVAEQFSSELDGEIVPVTDHSILDHHVGGGCACSDCVSQTQGYYPTMGMKRVAYAPFEIDYAEPVNLFAMRWDFAYDRERPDRAEHFWAKIGGRGPDLVERSVDYQELHMYMERGNNKASAFVDIPIRILDPVVNDNTAGLGDIVTGARAILFSGDDWHLSSIFRTYIPSGLARRGLGTGHTSLEPGVVGDYHCSDYTVLHAEFKFLFPLGGDSVFQGEVIRYGFGISHVIWERPCDNMAVIPTLELVGWSVLDGFETNELGRRQDVDPEGIFNIQPGVRIVLSETCELGISGSLAVTENHLYEELLRLEWRWFF